jgi:phage terminase large subunit-like protein
MVAARQPLDPWQADGVRLWLAVGEDGKWSCPECAEIVSRQNGKGAMLEARALTGLLLLGERLIVWTAHEVKTAMEGFRRCKALLAALGRQISDTLIEVDNVLIKINNANGEEGFERLDTGARIRFLARSKGSGRGFSCDLLILDEAFALTAEQYSALMYTMSARPDAQIIFTSSPPLDGLSGEILYTLRKRGEAGDPSLCWRDWGAAGELEDLTGIDLSDPALWAATNPALGGRITVATVEREYRASLAMLPEFGRERCGIWPRQITAEEAEPPVLDPTLWAKMLDAKSRRAGDVALAVDIAPMRNHACIGMVGPRDDGLWHMQVVDYRPGTDWLVERLVELRDALDPVAIAMDLKGGVAGPLGVELTEAGFAEPEEPEYPARGQLMIFTTADVVSAVAQFIDDYRAGQYRHVGDEPLSKAIANAKARPIGDAGQIAWGRKASAVDIGPLLTMTYGLYAYRARIDAVQARFEPAAFWV